MNIYEKIQAVKQLLLSANPKKSGQNKFANYTYYELSDFLPILIGLCTENNLFTRVSFTNELATLEIINSEKPEERVEYTSPMRELELKGCNQIQALGGVETYSRRYLYMSAFDITENDMFDAVVTDKVEKKLEKMSKEQATVLLNVLKDKGFTEEQIKQSLSKYKVTKVEDLTELQYGEILHKIKGV
jgi:hypothetical protein